MGGQEKAIPDEEIKPVYFEPLNYPLTARITHVQGTVVLMAKIDAKGNVVSADAISGAKSFIPETISNAKKWRFQPNPTGSVVIVYDFRIEGLCQLPCPSHFTFRPPNTATISVGEAVVDHN
jgi:TonB family protein